MILNPSRRLLASLLIFAGAAAGGRAQSTDAAAAPAGGPVVQMQQYTVTTGSSFPTAADATAVPVTVLGAQDLEQTGLSTNLLDILRKAIPAFAGRSNTGNSNATNTNQYTAGGSQIALRNLDTLVLINGRRVATSGINAVNGKSFVDINQIPTAAIDHIEVLADGASAIYGSDAVGGVINIILKSNFEGSEIGGRYGFASGDGHYTERSAYLVAGAAHHGVSLTVSASWAKTDPLWQSQRPFVASNPRAGTTLPGFVAGAYLAPGLNSPADKVGTGAKATAASLSDLVANGTYLAAGSASIPVFNAAPYQMILLQQEQRGAMADFSANLAGPRLVAFGDFLYSKTKSFDQGSSFLSNLSTVTVPAGAPYDPLTAAAAGVVMGHLNTPLQTYNDSTGERLTLGLRGAINENWNWEVGGTSSESKTTQQLRNELFTPNLAPAIAGGYDASGKVVAGGSYSQELGGFNAAAANYVYVPALDPFARSASAAMLANLYGTEVIKTKSSLESYDAKLVGMPFSLPAGKVGVALGAASRKEKLTGTPDQNSYNLSTSAINHNWGGGAVFFDPFSKSRTIDSYYAELRIPVAGPGWTRPGLHVLDLSLAGRSDRYSDTGTSSVPKLGLRWQPVDDQLTVRFTYSKAFTAPLLYDEYGPPSVGLATGNSFLYNFVLNGAGQKNSALIGLPYFSGNGNNPGIQPSRAWARSFGIVYSPKAVKGFTVSANYVDVYQKGLAAGLGASTIVADVNARGSASPYFSQIAVGAMPGTAGANQAALSAPGGLYNLLSGGSYASNLYILDHKVNSGGVRVEAVDLSAEYELATADLGRFTFATTGTFLQSFKVEDLPTLPFYEYAGYATNGKTMSGTLPQYSFYTTVEWKRHAWDLLVGSTFMSAVTDIQSGQVPATYLLTHTPSRVNSYTALDVQLGWTLHPASGAGLLGLFKETRLVVGINNLFDRMPPYSPLAQAASLNNNNVDVAAYSPVGRFYFVSLDQKF